MSRSVVSNLIAESEELSETLDRLETDNHKKLPSLLRVLALTLVSLPQAQFS
jgi:hypothetical protein